VFEGDETGVVDVEGAWVCHFEGTYRVVVSQSSAGCVRKRVFRFVFEAGRFRKSEAYQIRDLRQGTAGRERELSARCETKPFGKFGGLYLDWMV
jgi:hypothetical protein